MVMRRPRSIGSTCMAPSSSTPVKTCSSANAGMYCDTGSSRCHRPSSCSIIRAVPTTGLVIEKMRKIELSSTGASLPTSSLPTVSMKTTFPVPGQHRDDARELAVVDHRLHARVEPFEAPGGDAHLGGVGDGEVARRLRPGRGYRRGVKTAHDRRRAPPRRRPRTGTTATESTCHSRCPPLNPRLVRRARSTHACRRVPMTTAEGVDRAGRILREAARTEHQVPGTPDAGTPPTVRTRRRPAIR